MRASRASTSRRRDSTGTGGVVAADDFNRASGDDLGPNWTQIASRLAISSNMLSPDSTSSGLCRHIIEPTTTFLFSQITFLGWPSSETTTGPAIHIPAVGDGISSTGTFYVFTPSNTSKSLVALKRHNLNSSGFTTMGDEVEHDLEAGDVFRIVSEDSNIVGYINGVEVIRRSKGLAPLSEEDERGVGVFSSGDSDIELDDWSGGDA